MDRTAANRSLFLLGLTQERVYKRDKARRSRGLPGSGRKSRVQGAKAGRPTGVQTPPSPARGLKGPLCGGRRPPAAEGALPRPRQTPEAPPPLQGQTQIVPGAAVRPVAWGTKLNGLTSPGRRVATGMDSPFSSRALRSRSSRRRRGGAGAGPLGPRWPGSRLEDWELCGVRRKRCRLACDNPDTLPCPRLVGPEKAPLWPAAPGSRGQRLCCLHPISLPSLLFQPVSSPGPNLGSRSANRRQHRLFFSLLPGHLGNVGAWPPALGEEAWGPAPCILSKSCLLLRS